MQLCLAPAVELPTCAIIHVRVRSEHCTPCHSVLPCLSDIMSLVPCAHCSRSSDLQWRCLPKSMANTSHHPCCVAHAPCERTTWLTPVTFALQSDIANVFSAEVAAAALKTLAALPPQRFANMLVADGE